MYAGTYLQQFPCRFYRPSSGEAQLIYAPNLRSDHHIRFSVLSAGNFGLRLLVPNLPCRRWRIHPERLPGLGQPGTIDQSPHRLTRLGTIRRTARGLYHCFRHTADALLKVATISGNPFYPALLWNVSPPLGTLWFFKP